MASQNFSVQVRSLSGEAITRLQLPGSALVAELQGAVAQTTGVPGTYIKLVVEGGRQLKEAETLMASGIGPDFEVTFLVLPVRRLDFVRACRDGSGDAVTWSYMIANGADINALCTLSEKQPQERTFLYRVLNTGSVVPFMKKVSALHLAAHRGFYKACMFLLEQETFRRVNEVTGMHHDNEGDPEEDETKHDVGYSAGDLEDEQAESGDSEDGVNIGYGQLTALHIAILCQHSDVSLLLLSHKRFLLVDHMIKHPFGPIHALDIACKAMLPHVVRALLSQPSCPRLNESLDCYGHTVLMLAARIPGNVEVCRIILEDPRFTMLKKECMYGNALSYAEESGDQEICHLITEALSQNHSAMVVDAESLPELSRTEHKFVAAVMRSRAALASGSKAPVELVASLKELREVEGRLSAASSFSQAREGTLALSAGLRHVCITGLQSDLEKIELLCELEDLLFRGSFQSLLFCISARKTDWLTDHLVQQWLPARCWHDDIDLAEKQRITREFAEGAFNVLITNDNLYERGIDTPPLNLVLNFDIPELMPTDIPSEQDDTENWASSWLHKALGPCDVCGLQASCHPEYLGEGLLAMCDTCRSSFPRPPTYLQRAGHAERFQGQAIVVNLTTPEDEAVLRHFEQSCGTGSLSFEYMGPGDLRGLLAAFQAPTQVDCYM